MTDHGERAITVAALKHAVPYLRMYQDKTFVVKAGGAVFGEAERTFDRMLWLNPSDNQGIRFLIEGVRAGRSWDESRDE